MGFADIAKKLRSGGIPAWRVLYFLLLLRWWWLCGRRGSWLRWRERRLRRGQSGRPCLHPNVTYLVNASILPYRKVTLVLHVVEFIIRFDQRECTLHNVERLRVFPLVSLGGHPIYTACPSPFFLLYLFFDGVSVRCWGRAECPWACRGCRAAVVRAAECPWACRVMRARGVMAPALEWSSFSDSLP